MLWAWPVVERLQQESPNPRLMDAQLAASASLLTPPSAFQNNSNSSNNNNKKNVAWRSRKRTSGLLHQLYSHAVFCSAGARSLVGAFPCQRCFLVCGGRVFGNHLLWVLASAGPAGAGGVCVLRRSIPEGRARERLSVPQLLHPSLRRSAAKVWPLCGFGGRGPVGASGWQEKRAVNKAGPRQVPVAQHGLDPVPLAGSWH